MTLYNWKEKLTGNIFNRAHNYTIPSFLNSHIQHVFNTIQFPTNVIRNKKTKNTNIFNINITKNSNNFKGTTISFLNNLYKIPSNIGNTNISQAVFETNTENFQQSDLLKFQTKYGLTVQPAEVYGTTAKISGCNTNNCGEGSLDIQYIMGIAQKTPSIFWFEELGFGDPFYNFIVHVANTTNFPTTLSISWGAYEYQVDPSYLENFNIEAMKLTAMGVTIFVSSGDDGVSGYSCLCSQDSSTDNYWWQGANWTGTGYFPQYPATSPYVVSVGATMGPEKGNSEIACQSQYGGVITTGGGFSTHFPQPDYQKTAVSNFFLQSQNKKISFVHIDCLNR
jgi:tripeptidyl-peptidase-1